MLEQEKDASETLARSKSEGAVELTLTLTVTLTQVEERRGGGAEQVREERGTHAGRDGKDTDGIICRFPREVECCRKEMPGAANPIPNPNPNPE